MFYDCMERYELPINPDKEKWIDPLGRTIRRDTIDAYLAEINKNGGESWFYSGIYSVSPNYQNPKHSDSLFSFLEDKQEYVQEWFCVDDDPQRPFVSVIDPSTNRWKEHFTEQLRIVIEKIGFTGIHLDQYGSLDTRFKYRCKVDEMSEKIAKDHDNFEEIDKRVLMANFMSHLRKEIPQAKINFNAADGYGFEETLHLVDFPYIELWNDESVEHYSELLRNKGKFVIVAYTPKRKGLFDLETFARRKRVVNDAGGTFLYRGDDDKILVNCYFPSAEKVLL